MDILPRRRTTLRVSVWVEHAPPHLPVWRGVLITAAGQHLTFSTLAQLDRWLCELAGWQDPPTDAPASPNRQA